MCVCLTLGARSLFAAYLPLLPRPYNTKLHSHPNNCAREYYCGSHITQDAGFTSNHSVEIQLHGYSREVYTRTTV